MEELSVLLVEDNPQDAQLIKEYLSESDAVHFTVNDVPTMAEAIAALDGTAWDIVLLDLSLPDSTGLQTVRTLIGRFPAVVIVVLTGLTDDQVAIQAVRFGAQDYLEKGLLTPTLLSRAMRYAVERKRIIRQQDSLLADLAKALDEIEVLQGLLPVCRNCRRIHSAGDEWMTVEAFRSKRSGSDVKDEICPDCLRDLYGLETA
ncbi:MAG: response regulator [Thermodesulfobacteriota bacterium]